MASTMGSFAGEAEKHEGRMIDRPVVERARGILAA